MVTPPAFSAAMPVGANTTVFLWVDSIIFFNNVVFPVPAFPVRKTDLFVWFIKRSANSAGDRMSVVVMLIICNKKLESLLKLIKKTNSRVSFLRNICIKSKLYNKVCFVVVTLFYGRNLYTHSLL